MKQLAQFIQEKLKINSKSKVNTKRRLSLKNLDDSYWQNFTCRSATDLGVFENDIKYKEDDETPQYFIDKVQYKEQLFCYWYDAISLGLEEFYDKFRKELINRKYTTEDDLDTCVIDIYIDGDPEIQKNCKRYFEKYNIMPENIHI